MPASRVSRAGVALLVGLLASVSVRVAAAEESSGAKSASASAEDDPGRSEVWPRWRGADGSAVASGDRLPERWSASDGLAWSIEIPGEGSSSPIVWGDRVFVTSASDRGAKRSIHALATSSGDFLWSRSLSDDDPELSSSVTGHAASTPATDGRTVVAFFGNSGVVAYTAEGDFRWQRTFGAFDTELGLASSPILHRGNVIVVCDHDGDRFRTFDSFVVALDLGNGAIRWRTQRPELYRSWSTPIVVRTPTGDELIVCAQDAIRAYDPVGGGELWRVRGLTGWVTPSPVFADGIVYATSGKNGPVVALRAGGRGDVTDTHTDWSVPRVGAYVTSPVLYDGRLYVIRDNGVVRCFRPSTGERIFEGRLDGKFVASPIAGAGRIYFPAEDGTTWVLRAADELDVLAKNDVEEYTVASPAAAAGKLFLRTERRLICIGERDDRNRSATPGESALTRATEFLAREHASWPKKNGCFSCHNTGDAARALFAAQASGRRVPRGIWPETLPWLRAPARWGKSVVTDEFDDPELARIQYASALREAIAADAFGANRAAANEALRTAARDLRGAQHAEGSFAGGSENLVGGPTAYSSTLATYLAAAVLDTVDRLETKEAARRAADWLDARPIRNVHVAAIALLAQSTLSDRPNRARVRESLDLLGRTRSDDGGWGPYANDAPEVFDTALALLSLASARDREEILGPAKREVDTWIRAAREFLVSTQDEDGGWPETTRPSGAESYAQRISTTAWATLALLAVSS